MNGIQGVSCDFPWFLAPSSFPLMRPVCTPQGLGKEGEAGVEGLQVCLESQTVLHFSYVSLQLSLVNERGSAQTDQRSRPEDRPTQTHQMCQMCSGSPHQPGCGGGDVRALCWLVLANGQRGHFAENKVLLNLNWLTETELGTKGGRINCTVLMKGFNFKMYWRKDPQKVKAGWVEMYRVYREKGGCAVCINKYTYYCSYPNSCAMM